MNYDLTVGEPRKTLWRFTFPMFISVVFQQFYSITDSAIAGQFAGESALAAIGASYPITMIFMAIATGSNIGCTVVLSQLFGAKKYKDVKTAAYTALIFGAVLSGILTVIALISSSALLTAIQTPASIFTDAAAYMNIYLGGFAFLYLYNMANGVFNALGDSKTPLYLLIMSSIANVVLDYVFVAILNMGVSGAAWATFIAQGAACILAIIILLFRLSKLDSEKNISLFSVPKLKLILFIAIPSILQSSFVSVGNFFIQGLINSCGEAVIAGFSSAFKLNTFALTSITTVASAVSSFTAQNIGAGKYDRVRAGLKYGLILAMSFTVVFAFSYYFAGRHLLGIFMESDSSDAMATGIEFLKMIGPFYFVVCSKLVFDGVLRGAKAMRYFMITTFSDLIIRVVISYVLFPSMKQHGIWLSWPIGWVIGAFLSVLFYFLGVWNKSEKAGVKQEA